MRRRIYWLLPDVATARRAMDDLLLARVAESHIHVVGPEGADMSGLNQANILQTSDVIRAAQQGLVIGGVVGAAMGAVAAVVFPIVGETPQWGIVAVLAMLGGAFGAWASSMIGVSTPSHRLARFGTAIARGSFLVMADIPRTRVAEVEQRLQTHLPEARLEGRDPHIPAFP